MQGGIALRKETGIELRARATASFPPLSTTPGQVRTFVRNTFAAWSISETLDDVLLLTTELTTNAVVHAGTEIELVVEARPGALFVSVGDRYSARTIPGAVVAPPDSSESGRGILIVQSIASRWGVEHSSYGKHVWFEIPLLEQVPVHVSSRSADGGRRVAGGVLVASVSADKQGFVTGWHGDAAELLGWSADEILGRPLADIATVADRRASIVEHTRTQDRWYGTVSLQRSDGSLSEVCGWHQLVPATGGVQCLWSAVEAGWALAPPVAQGHLAGSSAPLAAVLGLSDSVLARLGLDDLLAQVLQRLCTTLGGDAAYVLLSDDAGSFVLKAAYGFDADEAASLRARSREGIAGRLAAHQLPIVLDDVSGLDADPLLVGQRLRSAVAAPLLVEGRMTGSLHVAARRAAAFKTEDAVRLTHVSDRIALAVESARLTELDRRRRGWLAYLAEASDLLAGTLELDRTFALVAQLVVPRLGEWCALHVLEEGGESALAYLWHADEAQADELRLAVGALPTPERRTKTALPSLSRRQPWRPPTEPSLAGYDRVVYPLIARNNVLGSLTVARPASLRFDDDEIDLTADLARRAALAIDNARLFQERVSVAKALQRSLLPPEAPVIDGFEIGVSYLAAGEGNDVGGDFYDVFRIDERRWGVAIGDVCGKGAAAAAVTGLARHTIRLLGRDGRPVTEVLERLNRAILEEGPRARFVTVAYAVVEPAAAGAAVDLCSAGHPLPILLGADGSVRSVGEPQSLLGVMDDPALAAQRINLRSGDTLVFFTDGVTERREGQRMLGEEGLANILGSCAGLPATAIAARIERAVADFQAEPARDDMAVVVIKLL